MFEKKSKVKNNWNLCFKYIKGEDKRKENENTKHCIIPST